jgi:DNA-binding CsgD family transcriptional regulator/PAS domain-containing protein
MGGLSGAPEQVPEPVPAEAASRGLTLAPLPQANTADLHLALDRCEFPVLVWSPPEGTILLANDAAAALVNVPLERLVGRQVFDFFAPRPAVEQLAAIIAAGDVDGLTGVRQLHPEGLEDVAIQFWTRVIELDGRRQSIALLLPQSEVPRLGRDPAAPWRDLMPIAVGVADEQWRIIEVSADIHEIAGRSPEECIGTDLLALFRESDVSEIPRGPDIAQLTALSLRHVRMDRPDGTWLETSLLVAPFDKARRESVFAIVGRSKRPVDVTPDRVTSLEMHLRRIGSEVRAAGVLDAFEGLPIASQHPQLRQLTTRQWEILSLLLEGQRVSTIADTLFVSQSTVRNHLATIFKKFGVHSQAELLELLKPATQPGP